jgi:hypothetical protein
MPDHRPDEVIAGFATDRQLRAALADPAVARLSPGPARRLLERLAEAVGPYTLECELDLRRRRRHARAS